MKAKSIVFMLAFCVAGLLILTAADSQKPFGGSEDVAFAKELWVELGNYTDWKMKSSFYPGNSPHGKFLRIYYNLVNVDDEPYHVIVKDNYGGEGASMQSVSSNPEEYLMAITIMVQRETGYDPDNNNWYYVKYSPGGMVMENSEGMQLAGRVAKGMDTGCIACHANAEGGDYLFSND